MTFAPARAASTADSPGPYLLVTAFISMQSVETRPVKPTSPRSSPWMILGERVDGYSGSRALNWTWVTIMAAIPASLAARNGTRSVSHMSSSGPSMTGRLTCGSTGVFALPGKCLAVAATPAFWKPRTCATPSLPTRSGSVPRERTPTEGLWMLWVRSMAGARFQLIPSARISAPKADDTSSASSSESAAPRAMAPGLSVNPSRSRATTPPSWSIATSIGREAASWHAWVSSATCAGLSMLRANRITPPMRPLSSQRRMWSGGSRPWKPTTSICPIFLSVDSVLEYLAFCCMGGFRWYFLDVLYIIGSPS